MRGHSLTHHSVIPAKAGISVYSRTPSHPQTEIPTCAVMTRWMWTGQALCNILILRCERSEPRRTPRLSTKLAPQITYPRPSTPTHIGPIPSAWCGRRDERCERRGQPGEGVSCAPRGAEGRRPVRTGYSSVVLARAPRPEAPAPGTRERLLLFLRRPCVPGPRHHADGEGQGQSQGDPSRAGDGAVYDDQPRVHGSASPHAPAARRPIPRRRPERPGPAGWLASGRSGCRRRVR